MVIIMDKIDKLLRKLNKRYVYDGIKLKSYISKIEEEFDKRYSHYIQKEVYRYLFKKLNKECLSKTGRIWLKIKYFIKIDGAK